MPEIEDDINEILMDTYTEIARVEQAALSGSRLKGLSITEIHTIQAIGKKRCSMGPLASALGVTMATLTVAIDRLEKKGYVLRTRSETDRRMVFVELTHNGMVAFRIHNMYHIRLMNEMLEGLSDHDKEVLHMVLGRINRYFRNSLKEEPKQRDSHTRDRALPAAEALNQ